MCQDDLEYVSISLSNREHSHFFKLAGDSAYKQLHDNEQYIIIHLEVNFCPPVECQYSIRPLVALFLFSPGKYLTF